ncbi:hypothetical protein [Lysobacter gummosus]|uniref:hypothetical protein n=1 Tax=Lysobacter gummosus TaxID=262324 RepID=UPI003624C891
MRSIYFQISEGYFSNLPSSCVNRKYLRFLHRPNQPGQTRGESRCPVFRPPPRSSPPLPPPSRCCRR